MISIHALLAESDFLLQEKRVNLSNISIHALLAESDPRPRRRRRRGCYFYPRSPCGERPNKHQNQPRRNTPYFYPRSPCGERHFRCSVKCGICNFYPRSPCGERRPDGKRTSILHQFLSTLSLRRATAKVHKTVGHFCAYETNFMGIASSC